MDLSWIIKSIPSYLYDLKDCWMIAKTIAQIYFGEDYELLYLNNIFFYKEGNVATFDDIIKKNSKLDLFGDDIDTEIMAESKFLSQIVELECEYYQLGNKRSIENFLTQKIISGGIYAIWFDAYNCKWNPMYQKQHIFHCVTVFEVRNRECLLFDSLKEENFFAVSLDDIIEIAVYLFCLKKKELKIFYSYDERVKMYISSIVKNEKLYRIIPENISCFYKDLKRIKTSILQDTEFKDESTARLALRIFIRQQQQTSLQLEALKKVTNIQNDLIEILQEINKNWKSTSGFLGRMCFSEGQKKIDNYEKICSCMELIEKETRDFYNNLVKIV